MNEYNKTQRRDKEKRKKREINNNKEKEKREIKKRNIKRERKKRKKTGKKIRKNKRMKMRKREKEIYIWSTFILQIEDGKQNNIENITLCIRDRLTGAVYGLYHNLWVRMNRGILQMTDLSILRLAGQIWTTEDVRGLVHSNIFEQAANFVTFVSTN